MPQEGTQKIGYHSKDNDKVIGVINIQDVVNLHSFLPNQPPAN